MNEHSGDDISPERVSALAKALEHADSEARWRAAYELGELKTKAVNTVPVLLRALKDEDIIVRRVVATALGEIGAEEAVPALIVAVRDPDASVRYSAVRSLASFKSQASEAIPALIEALNDRPVGEAAASALGEIGRETGEGIPALIGALKEGDTRVRVWAIKALGAIGPKARDAITVLVAAREDADREVRLAAKCALNSISPDDYPLEFDDLLRLFDPNAAWKTEKSACPACGSQHMGRIRYGLYTEFGFALIGESGDRAGGCCVSGDSPRWFCKDCEASW